MTSGADAQQDCVQILFLTALDKFDLIAFRCVNEGNSTAVRRMWSVRQRMAFCRGVFGELVQIVDFKCEMRQIGPTTIGPLPSNLHISISSSLPGAFRKPSCDPRPEVW